MYWNDSTSSIDTLLTTEGVTLGVVLNEDDILQECIGQNNALIAYLSDDAQLTEMLSIITKDPTNTTNDIERYKNANTVCEILTYDGNVFADIIVKNDKYLQHLWSFVSLIDSQESQDDQSDSSTSSAPLNPLLASFFTKIFLYLFTHHTDPILDFLARQEAPNDLVSVALRHINTSAIMDLVYKTWEYINMDKKIGQEKIDKYNDLLMKNGFIEKCIDIFKDKSADTKQQNVANLLSDLIKTGRELLVHNAKEQVDGLLAVFETTTVSQTLLQNMFETKTKHSIVSGLKVIQDLLVYRMQIQQLINQQNEQLSSLANKQEAPDDNMEGMPTFMKSNNSPNLNDVQFISPQLASPADIHGGHLSRCVRNVCIALHERLEDFIRLLVDPANLSPIPTTAGVINSPLGLIRIEIIHLFVALFATSDYSILEKCSQLNVLKLLTDLFFEYPLNNQLHKYYEHIIEYLFQNYASFKNIYDKYSAKEVLNELIEEVGGETASESKLSSDENVDDSKGNDSPNEEEKGDNSPKESSSSNGTVTPPNDEKKARFVKLFEITKVLAKQVIVDCHLIEKIVDSYSQEIVPKGRYEKFPDADKDKEMKELSFIKSEVKPEIEDAQAPKENVEPEIEKVEEPLKEEPSNAEPSKEDVAPKEPVEIPAPKSIRPAYMGHLRLIANVLKDRCTDELLSECNLDSEVLQQWNEFKTGKLVQFNELIASRLVPESKNDESNDQDIFQRYQIESVSQALPASVELLPSDFDQHSFGDINQQLKLSNGPDFDFDSLWTQANEKFSDLDKFFDEKCSSIFDDDDGDPFNDSTTENPLGASFKKERPAILISTLKNEFGSYDDPFLNTNDSKDDMDTGFANFTQMNSDPWTENVLASKEADQLPSWSADFDSQPETTNDEDSAALNLHNDADMLIENVDSADAQKVEELK